MKRSYFLAKNALLIEGGYLFGIGKESEQYYHGEYKMLNNGNDNKNSWADYWHPEQPAQDDLKDFRDNGHEVMDSSSDGLRFDAIPAVSNAISTNYLGTHTPEEAAEARVREAKAAAAAFSATTTETTPLTDAQLKTSAAQTATVTFTGDPDYVQSIRDLVNGVSLTDDIKAERQQEMVIALLGNSSFMKAALTKFLSPEALASYINLLVININK